MKTLQKNRIETIKIKQELDTDPDLSWLGTYAKHPAGPNTRDREERGECGRNEFRYFNCGDNYKGSSAEDMKKYCEQDYQRAEQFNSGYWWMIGIKAEAILYVEGVRQAVTSGGLWGIESDSDKKSLAEVGAEQLAELVTILKSLGFHGRAIAKHCPKDTEPQE